jgi:hypothetical protein
LTRAPDRAERRNPQAALGPDAVEFVADTDSLLTKCSCSASDDQPY